MKTLLLGLLCWFLLNISGCASKAEHVADGKHMTLHVEAIIVDVIDSNLVVLPGVSETGKLETIRAPAVVLDPIVRNSEIRLRRMILFLGATDLQRNLRVGDTLGFDILESRFPDLSYSGSATLEGRDPVFLTELRNIVVTKAVSR